VIDVTRLYCGQPSFGDHLRYAGKRKPIVVWNSTRRCNLKCLHCYADSENQEYSNELSTGEIQKVIRDLGSFNVPVFLFSGGEPFFRDDIYENAALAHSLGIRTVISTNGTMITEKTAEKIKKTGFGYVGISLDGIGDTNDLFRGKKGAFSAAIRGLDNCVAVGQKTGIRLTLTRHSFEEIDGIFDFIEEHRINRVCFYHLVYAGRGSRIREDDLTLEESRQAVDTIIDRAADFHKRGLNVEVLTVDNHCDGPYLYLRMLKEGSPRAEEVYRFLKLNGGNSSGIGIADIDNEGNVHADQFWWHYSFGNVRDRKFSEIWEDRSDQLMAGLKNRKSLLKGRCSRCRWLDICNGNLRVRAEKVFDDIWESDPGCYLSDEEIGLSGGGV